MLFVAYLAAGLAAAAAPPSLTAAEQAWIHGRMTTLGFIPLEEMTFGGRDVRRVMPIDPYGGLPIPGIEVERHGDGRMTLRAQYRGFTGPAYPVTSEEWSSLQALEAAAFAPPGKSGLQPMPGVVIHCWSGLVEASPARAAHWGCDPNSAASRRYTEAVLELAIAKATCAASDKDVLWRFMDCFRDNDTLDDPALQAKLAEVREKWTRQREPGADILRAARTALQAAEAERSPAALAKAQEAVFAFGRQQRALRDILLASWKVLNPQVPVDEKTGAILRRTQRGWNEDIEGQNTNYIELLERLARLLPVDRRPL